jgi:hypothetical protein
MTKVRNFLLLTALFCVSNVFAQAPAEGNVDMADELRSSGKIYVVVGVLVIILAGLILYLISIDRKVSKLEKIIEKEKEQRK